MDCENNFVLIYQCISVHICRHSVAVDSCMDCENNSVLIYQCISVHICRHSVAADSCMDCARESSDALFQRTSGNAGVENSLLEEYCRVNDVLLAPVQSNGHCLFEAFTTFTESTTSTVKGLQSSVRKHIVENPALYGPHTPDNEKDRVVENLSLYLRDWQFNDSVADLCLYALANVTEAKIEIVSISDGRVQATTVTPHTSIFKTTVKLSPTCQKTQPHYNALTPCTSSYGSLAEGESLEFHNNDKKIPIFQKGECDEFKKSPRILDLLCHPSKHKLCQKAPSQVQYSGMFVQDLNAIPFGDWTADGNGKWTCRGVRRCLFTPTGNGFQNEGLVKSSYTPQETVLVRKYWTQTQHPECTRRTYHGVDSTKRPLNNVAILQHPFPSKEDDVTLTSRGNSKSGQPYSKMKPGIRAKLARKSLNQMSQHACMEILEEVGGIESAAANEIPARDMIYRMKGSKYSCNEDELEALKGWASTDGNCFVRKIQDLLCWALMNSWTNWRNSAQVILKAVLLA